MSEQAPTVEDMFRGMNDSELLAYKVKMVGEVTRLLGSIAMIDDIRAERTPFDQEADILPFECKS